MNPGTRSESGVAQFAASCKVPAQFPGYSTGLGDSLKNDAQVVWDEIK